MSAIETLDTRGLLCPMPVIRTQDRVKTLSPGAVLEVVATDAGTLHDIPAWCRVHGHEVLCIVEEDGSQAHPEQQHGHGTAKDALVASVATAGEIRIRLKVGDVFLPRI